MCSWTKTAESKCPPPRCVLLRQLTLHGTEEQIVGRSHPTFRRGLIACPGADFIFSS